MTRPVWKRHFYRLIDREVSSLTRYYDRAIEGDDVPDLTAERDRRTAVVLNGTLNRELNIQELLTRLRGRLGRTSRLVVIAYNPYLSFVYRIATALGLRDPDPGATFVTMTDLRNIARLSRFEVVRARPIAVFPWKLLGIGTLLNTLLSTLPLVRWLGIVNVITMRPLIATGERPSLSIVIPARNERGNIAAAVTRIPDLGVPTELIFVEGHSTDGTWEEIEKIDASPRPGMTVKRLRQTGRGKADAVRLGFQHATGDLLTILDADLTMPPELLTQFYDAWVDGHGDFINGSRLVYPMEGRAMRFLNRLGNVVFAKLLSSVLDVPIGDSLCGTKLFTRHDYARMRAWRDDFGDFDPFGDFELLFPAAVLGLGIIDVPVRYRARTYGETNISRMTHGAMLLRMTLIGLFRIRSGL
jgi:hypothetical protein